MSGPATTTYKSTGTYTAWGGPSDGPPPPPPGGGLNYTSLGTAVILPTFNSVTVEIPYSGGWRTALNAPGTGFASDDRFVPLRIQAWFKKSTDPDANMPAVPANTAAVVGWRAFFGTAKYRAFHRAEQSSGVKTLTGCALFLDPGTTYDLKITISENLADLSGGTVTLGGHGVVAYQFTTRSDLATDFHNIEDWSAGAQPTYTHYYIDGASGADGNAGSIVSPWATLQKGVTIANAASANSKIVFHVAKSNYVIPTSALAPASGAKIVFTCDNIAVDGTFSDFLNKVEDVGSTYRDAKSRLAVRQVLNSGNHATVTPTPTFGGWVLTTFSIPAVYLNKGIVVPTSRSTSVTLGTSPGQVSTFKMWKRAGVIESSGIGGMVISSNQNTDEARQVPHLNQSLGSYNDSLGIAWYLHSAPTEDYIVTGFRANGTHQYGVFEYGGATYCLPEWWNGAPVTGANDEYGKAIVDLNACYVWTLEQSLPGQSTNGLGVWVVEGQPNLAEANQPQVRIDGFHFRMYCIYTKGWAYNTVVSRCHFDSAGTVDQAAGVGFAQTLTNGVKYFGKGHIVQMCNFLTNGRCSTDQTNDPSVSWYGVKIQTLLWCGTGAAAPYILAWNGAWVDLQTHAIGGHGGAEAMIWRWNTATGTFNGYNQRADQGRQGFRGSDIYECISRKITDNTFEPEEDGSSGIKIWDCEIYSDLSPFAGSPSHFGPVIWAYMTIYDYGNNMLRVEPATRLNQASDPQAGKLWKYGIKNREIACNIYIGCTSYTAQDFHHHDPDGGGLFGPPFWCFNNVIRTRRHLFNVSNGTRRAPYTEYLKYPWDTAAVGAWSAGASIIVGQVKRPTVATGYYYQASNAGTTGGVQPTWPTTPGNTVNDNGITWTCLGQLAPDIWDEDGNAMSCTDAAAQITVDTKNHITGNSIANYRTSIANFGVTAGVNTNKQGGADKAVTSTPSLVTWLDSELNDPANQDLRSKVGSVLRAGGVVVENYCDIKKPGDWVALVPRWMYTDAAPDAGMGRRA